MLLLLLPVLVSLLFVPHWYFIDTLVVLQVVSTVQLILNIIVYPFFLVYIGGRLVFGKNKSPGSVTALSCVSAVVSILAHFVCFELKWGMLTTPSARSLVTLALSLVIALVVVLKGGSMFRHGRKELRRTQQG